MSNLRSKSPAALKVLRSCAFEAPLMLEARDLRKCYPGKNAPALDGASFKLARGEGLALLGSNGSGKTTLLSLLSGGVTPDAGSSYVLGESVARPHVRRGLGFVPQELALYEELTGAENARLFARLAGVHGAALEPAIERALRAADLLFVRNARASSYSGGMRRRLSVACALVHSPSVLLLDEPFSGIDEDSRDRLLRVLLAEKQRGVSLVLSTHRLDEVATLCDRFLLLSRGRIVRDRVLHIDEPLDEHPYPEGQDS